jgi:hypothetical protein
VSGSTFIPGPLARPVGASSFAGWTTARPTFTDGGIVFDAELDEATISIIWRYITSVDDTEMVRREQLEDARVNGATNLLDMVAAFVTKRPLPEPIFPAPEPEPGVGS